MNIFQSFGCPVAGSVRIQVAVAGFGHAHGFVVINHHPRIAGIHGPVTVGVFKQIPVFVHEQGMNLPDPVNGIAAGQFHRGPENGLIDRALTPPGRRDDRSGGAGRSAGPDRLKGVSEGGFQLGGV